MISVINKVQGWLIHLLGGSTSEDVNRLTAHLKSRIDLLEAGIKQTYQKGVNQMVIEFDYKLKHMQSKGVRAQYHEIIQWVNKLYLAL